LHWELGNELWGSWNLGWPTIQQLPGRTSAFSQAVRAVDPNAQLIATGGDPDGFHDWNAAQLSTPAGTFNYLSTHFVVTTDESKMNHPSAEFLAQATFALPTELGRRLRRAQEQIDSTPAFVNHAHLAFTEWLFISQRWDTPKYSNMGGAIAAAGFLNMLMKNADIVPISDMTGIMEFGGIWKKRGQVYAVPAYYAFRMYSTADASRPVKVSASAGSYTVRNGISRLPDIEDVPYLDVFAALNDGGSTLTLFVVNLHLQHDMAAEIRTLGFHTKAEGSVQSLTSGSLYDENSELAPIQVTPTESSIAAKEDTLRYVFPHQSITVITLRRK